MSEHALPTPIMSAFETAPHTKPGGETPLAVPDAQADDTRPGLDEVTNWLLDGRFFTLDTAGRVTMWSQGAAATFGWSRKDVAGSAFVDTLLAAGERASQTECLEKLFAAGASAGAGFSGEVAACDAEGRALSAAFAFVPIPISAGYEFNGLLKDVSARSGDRSSLNELRGRHEAVLGLIEGAITGKAAEAAETEEGGHLAGALVVFRAGERPPPPPAPSAGGQPDNVVSIADAANADEARAQLERARREAEEGRVEVRNLAGQLEEARREAQRSRNEVDQARQEATDARDQLALAQHEAAELQRKLEDERRQADTAAAGSESSRIRAEEAQRESDRLRLELREARDFARGAAGRAEEELAKERAEAERAARELADVRAAAEGRAAEVETLRERVQSTQRELGTLRADLESTRAEAARDLALSTRRGEDLDRMRDELADARAELFHARLVLERAPTATAIARPDGRYVEVNAAFCDSVGYPAAVLLSDEPPAIVHPDDVEANREVARRLIAGRQDAARGYRRYVHADGRTMTMRERIAALPGPDGRPNMLVIQVEETQGDEGPDHVVIDADVAGEGSTDLVPSGAPSAAEAVSGDTMRRALEDDLFELHCQPLLDLRTNEVSQYELLIRMVAEDGRRILPEAFLGPARRAGLASAIDRWVVRNAIRLLAEASDAGHDVTLEVNLSPEAVHDPDLPVLVDQELASTPVDPARLVLEVTGQTAVDNLDATRAMAKRLRGLGCRFALDDFRSTFGSFRLLKDLPLDYLKLDGELVESLSESRTSQLIVKALVDVASGTGTKTVAVFVSDEETVALLRQQGVDYAQGYRIGRPRAVAEVWPDLGQAALPSG